MTGRERVEWALAGKPAGRVPVMLHNFMMAAREYGVTVAQFRSDPRVIAAAFVASVERYGLDGVVIDVDTATLVGAVRVPVEFPEDLPARTRGGCLASLEGVRDLEPADVAADARIQIWLEAVRLVKAAVGDQVFVRGNCDRGCASRGDGRDRS
ncbi:MAG: uroporphyrinogen decarboxylase family protein [Bacteroidales bacterium]